MNSLIMEGLDIVWYQNLFDFGSVFIKQPFRMKTAGPQSPSDRFECLSKMGQQQEYWAY